MSRSLHAIFLFVLLVTVPFYGEPLHLNGTFAGDVSAPMPRNWKQNLGDWFKPYGVVRYLGPNQLKVVSNGKKSVYVDEVSRFPVVVEGNLSLQVAVRGSGRVGFLVHLYDSLGKRLTTLTSAYPVAASGLTVRYAHRFKAHYGGKEARSFSVGVFIEKNSEVILSDFVADFVKRLPNCCLQPVTRHDWAASTYRQLTRQASLDKPASVMFLGDSITQLWSFSVNHRFPGGLEVWNKYFKPLGAVNYGVSGDRIENVLWRITEGSQLACDPEVIVLLVGTNNLHQSPQNSPAEINEGIDHLLEVIGNTCPKAKILLLGLFPRAGKYPIRDINARLRTTSRRRKVSFLDVGFMLTRGKAEVSKEIFRDGLHLSPYGYEILAESILPEIRRLQAARENALMKLPERTSEWRIFLAQDAPVPERKAAEELRYFWGRLFGETPEIISELEKTPRKVIFVGQSPQAAVYVPDVSFASLKTDEIILRTCGENLVVTGARPRGSLYAVYTLLEDFLGVRFYSSYEQEVPRLDKFVLPKIQVRYAPVIRARGAFFHDLLYADQHFAIRQRNNEDYLKGMRDYGCEINFLGGVHTFDRWLPAKDYLKKHPEYFSLHGTVREGGQRKGQLCLSNDAMRQELTRNLLCFLRKHPEATMVSVSQNDNTFPCECQRCLAENKREGSPSGPMIRFVNQVAAEVEKEFPQVTVQTFAYQYTQKPPRYARPRKNVEIRLCSIGSNFAAPLDSPGNQSFSADLRGWSQIAPRLSVWNYVANFSNYLTPFPNLRTLATDIQSFAHYGVSAVLEQGDWNSGGVTGDFVALKAYVISKLLWNPQRDVRKLIDEFVDGYYGAAGGYIKEYWQFLEERVNANGTYLGCFTDYVDKILSLNDILKAYGMMQNAERTVQQQPLVYQERVKVAGLPIRFAMLERAVPLKQMCGDATPDLERIYVETMSVALRNRTHKYTEVTSFEKLAEKLRRQVEASKQLKRISVRPARCTHGLKPGSYWDIQDICKQVRDDQASDGSASRETGKVYTWSLQFPPSLDNFPMHPGKYRLIAVLRAECKDGKGLVGEGAEAGSYDMRKKIITMKKIPLADLADKPYQEVDLGIHVLNPNCYLYVAPCKNDAMNYLYLDRMIAIKVE